MTPLETIFGLPKVEVIKMIGAMEFVQTNKAISTLQANIEIH